MKKVKLFEDYYLVEKKITLDWDDNEQAIKFSDGEVASVDYDGDFKYRGELFSTHDHTGPEDLIKDLEQRFKKDKFKWVGESFNKAKVEDLTSEEVAAKWKVGTKIKWTSPDGVLDDIVQGYDGIQVKINSGGTIPYKSIVENRSALESKYNGNIAGDAAEYIAKELSQYVKGIINQSNDNVTYFHLKDKSKKDLVIKMLMDLYSIEAQDGGNQFSPSPTIKFDNNQIVESISVNESKTLDRDEMMAHLDAKYGFRARTTEEFNNNSGGIWVSGEGSPSLGGKKIYNYYANTKGYEFGVLNRYEEAINKLGWYSEWYDAGTVMIWPL